MLRRRNLRLDNGPGWIAQNPLDRLAEGFFLQLQQSSQTPHTVTPMTKKSHQFQQPNWPPYQSEIGIGQNQSFTSILSER